MTKPNDVIAILVTAFTLGGFIAFYLFAYRFRVRRDGDSDSDDDEDDDERNGAADDSGHATAASSAFSTSSTEEGAPAEEVPYPEPVAFAPGAPGPGIRAPALGGNAV
ncbi:hypothetical protein GQX73_g4259 [Xylaria multiplex]|uniref:Uncharacterized protein n=1 Tax=Xylaria multiplex TaxID=323545 RepID=A0A7C8IW11_9PEZI|nr:hypothetical protein GQX73_g4259 [Xylaria multiplex]